MFKKVLINSIIIFLLSSLIHSLFNYLPIFPISILTPVNESVFEHMKMIFTAYMLFTLIIWLFYKDKPHNFVALNTFGSLINIIIFLIIYLPIYNIFGENMIVTLSLFFISIFITNLLMYKYSDKKENKKIRTAAYITIAIVYLIFGFLTYNPIKCKFFMDPTNNTYGIYKIK